MSKRSESRMENILKKYNVTLDKSSYEILIGRGIINYIAKFLTSRTKDNRVIIVIDRFLSAKILDHLSRELSEKGFNVFTHTFDAGKQNKNINEAIEIYKILESNDFARDSTIIAIGGGIIGDLAGFVASTYLRGMNLIHVPTTLTSMIDSSIGGKVAIHFLKTVNAIGNYYHPILNIIDLTFLDTLPDRDLMAGMSEIIKCSIICDRELFDYLFTSNEEILKLQEDALLKIICRTIEIKLDHVKDDIREQNKRLKLNYGHTMGHAIETSTGVFKEVFRHGEGVSLGMVGAAHIAREYFDYGGEVFKYHKEILQMYGLPTSIESNNIGFQRERLREECLRIILKDKKRKGNKLRFILPLDIGKSDIYTDIPEELIERAFSYLIRE